jgi:hypothetical protein
MGITFTYLARVAGARGDHVQTMALASQGLRALRDVAMSRDSASALTVLAGAACAMGSAALATRLYAAVAHLYQHVPPTRLERARFDQVVAVARAALGEEAFEAA